MSTKELKLAIDNKLNHMTAKQLEKALDYITEVEKSQGLNFNINEVSGKLVEENIELLKRLAQ